MIGISIGALNSTIALGKIIPSQLLFKSELLLSDTSLRTCPSIISFTSSHRLIGDQASLVIKKNINTSFQNIIRLIGFNLNVPFCQKEYNKYYYIGGKYNSEKNKFPIIDNEMLSPEEIVLSYLHLLYNSYIYEKNIETEYFVFSVPDYFTCLHKEYFKRIIDSLNIKKDYSIINESSAITLYFGYKNYNEYFINKKQVDQKIIAEVNPSITKYILFIDAGHSKITFILSKLNFKLFQVLNSVTIPFLGGRDLDNKIFQYCAKNFMDNYGIDISNDNKVKIRLMNPIMKARKTLTVNQDTHINIDSLKDDNDLSLILKREDFEKLINEELMLFKNELIKFCKNNEKNFPDANISNIEMAGELMRTPCLQNIVKEVTGKSLSKTILTDECISIGCCLYGTLLKGCFPIKDFSGIYHLNNYTINISINGGEMNKFIGNNEYLPAYKSFYFDEKYFENPKIIISFYYDKNEIENYLKTDTGLLCTYEFNCNEIVNLSGGMKNVKITFLVNNTGNIHINSLESRVFEEEYMKLEVNNNVFKIIKREIYPEKEETEKMIEKYKNREKILFEVDKNFKNYSKIKNNVLNKLYNIKSKINENNLGENIFENRKISEILDEIENKLIDSNDGLLNLDNINDYLDKVVNNFTNDDLKNKVLALKNKITDYQNRLSEEYTKLLSGSQSPLNENQINDASNMLIHFIKKLNFILSVDDLNNIDNEFQKEIKKYF